MIHTLNNINKLRAQNYRLLSLLFKTEVTATIYDMFVEMYYPNKERIFESITYKDKNTYIENLAVDFARIFLAAGINHGSAAFPYESVYTSSKKIVMQDAWENVKKIYMEHGFSLENVSSDILEDHIAMELEFMAHLCEEDNVDYDFSADFIKNHLLNWCEAFCMDIKKFASESFYKKLADATVDFVTNDLAYINAAREAIKNF